MIWEKISAYSPYMLSKLLDTATTSNLPNLLQSLTFSISYHPACTLQLKIWRRFQFGEIKGKGEANV